MSEAQRIAAKLTEAQRERLLGEENGNCPAGIAFALIDEGLIGFHPTDRRGWAWTDLGLEVRKILEAQS